MSFPWSRYGGGIGLGLFSVVLFLLGAFLSLVEFCCWSLAFAEDANGYSTVATLRELGGIAGCTTGLFLSLWTY